MDIFYTRPLPEKGVSLIEELDLLLVADSVKQMRKVLLSLPNVFRHHR
jgi:hypothetical protein